MARSSVAIDVFAFAAALGVAILSNCSYAVAIYPAGVPDTQDMPSVFVEGFNSSGVPFCVAPNCVPSSTEQLNRCFAGNMGKVYVVNVDLLLRDAFDTRFGQHGGHEPLGNIHSCGPLVRLCPTNKGCAWARFASEHFPDAVSVGFFRCGVCSLPPQIHAFALASWAYPSFHHSADYGCARDTHLKGNLLYRHSVGKVGYNGLRVDG